MNQTKGQAMTYIRNSHSIEVEQQSVLAFEAFSSCFSWKGLGNSDLGGIFSCELVGLYLGSF